MQTSEQQIIAALKNSKINFENRENQERTYSRVPMPFTDDHVLTPTLLARISPFKPLKRGQKRTFHKNEILYRNQYGYIKYTGETLGIDDQNVFLQLLRMAREKLFSKEKIIRLEFSLRWFLKELGRSISGKSVNLLKENFNRLMTGGTEISTKKGQSFAGCFIDHWKIDEETGKCVVRINPEISDFYYRYGGYTQIDVEQRQLLIGDITKSLHMFFSSQRNKKIGHHFDYTFQELVEVLNLGEYKRNRRLKESFKKSFHQLYKQGFLLKYNLKDDRVSGVISPY